MSINIYVSGGQFGNPFYKFYADKEGTQEIENLIIDTNETYIFERVNNQTSHPFYISDTGYKQQSSDNLIISGDGNSASGITGSQSFSLTFTDENLALDDLFYFCTSHSSMFSSFNIETSSPILFTSGDVIEISEETADQNEFEVNQTVEQVITDLTPYLGNSYGQFIYDTSLNTILLAGKPSGPYDEFSQEILGLLDAQALDDAENGGFAEFDLTEDIFGPSDVISFDFTIISESFEDSIYFVITDGESLETPISNQIIYINLGTPQDINFIPNLAYTQTNEGYEVTGEYVEYIDQLGYVPEEFEAQVGGEKKVKYKNVFWEYQVPEDYINGYKIYIGAVNGQDNILAPIFKVDNLQITNTSDNSTQLLWEASPDQNNWETISTNQLSYEINTVLKEK